MKAEPSTAGTALNQRGNTDGRNSGARPNSRRHASDTPHTANRRTCLVCTITHRCLLSHVGGRDEKAPAGRSAGAQRRACSDRPVSSGGLALPYEKTKYGETRLGITQTRLRDTFVLVLEGASFHWTKVCVTHAFYVSEACERARVGRHRNSNTMTRYPIPAPFVNCLHPIALVGEMGLRHRPPQGSTPLKKTDGMACGAGPFPGPARSRRHGGAAREGASFRGTRVPLSPIRGWPAHAARHRRPPSG